MSFDPSKFGKWSHKAIQMDKAVLERAKKVNALYVRGATDGEKSAAFNRLNSIAVASNVQIDMLLKVLNAA